MNRPKDAEAKSGDASLETPSSSNKSSTGESDPMQQQSQRNRFQPFRDEDDNERGDEDSEEQHHRKMFLKTQAVDNILNREIMQLSLQARNDIQEEIHGVKCLAPLETPEFLKRSISELDAQLNKMIILSSASTSIPSISSANNNNKNNALFLVKNLGSRSYANSAEFKLRFLRCKLFDIPQAASSLCGYLDRIHSLFGEIALERELNLYQDFTKEELREFRKGYYQLLPFRDRSGRRILIVFPRNSNNNNNNNAERMGPELQVRT